MSGIRTNAAAELLGVSPNTLRSWERRFGYPKPRRTSGGHRQYDLVELEASGNRVGELFVYSFIRWKFAKPQQKPDDDCYPLVKITGK